MEARELRIGNLVNIKSHADEIGISALGIDNFYKGDLKVEPIILTDKWLLNFGFYCESITGVFKKYTKNKIEVWHDSINDTFLLENIKNKKVYMQHVHQLQNLYFALTGGELVVLKGVTNIFDYTEDCNHPFTYISDDNMKICSTCGEVIN